MGFAGQTLKAEFLPERLIPPANLSTKTTVLWLNLRLRKTRTLLSVQAPGDYTRRHAKACMGHRRRADHSLSGRLVGLLPLPKELRTKPGQSATDRRANGLGK